MALRKHRPGELAIEQTRDLGRVRAMLSAGGLTTDGIEWPAACYLLAFLGDEPVGVIGVEPKIDAALLRSLYVVESMRRRGIGIALVAVARKAAHTRGARHLYAFSAAASELFVKLGFEQVAVEDVVAALRSVPGVEFFIAHPDELAGEVAFHLDISADGVIQR